MKEFCNLFEKDFRMEDFNRKDMMKYGVIAPLVLFVLLIIFD